jgi:hypothetical protein
LSLLKKTSIYKIFQLNVTKSSRSAIKLYCTFSVLIFLFRTNEKDLFVFGENAIGEEFMSARAFTNQPATSISKQINVINYLRFVSQMALRAGE